MKKIKIRLTENSKKIISLEEAPAVNRMLEALHENEDDQAICDPFYLSIAMSCITEYGYNWEYYDIKAEIAKNCRVWNYWTEESKDFDVWISFKAFDEYGGFYVVNCYLSDIYSVTSENKTETRKHMYIRAYKEQK